MLCLAKRDIAPWGAVIFLAEQGVVLREGAMVCLGIEAFFLQKKFQKNFHDFCQDPKKGSFFV